MSAITKTSLINKALTLCGAAPITNITDDTNSARIASRVYDISRISILSECRWTFATTRASLSVSAVAEPWYHTDGEQTVYVKPSICVRIFETSDPCALWREEGDYIISNTSGLGIKFVFDLDNPAKYPGLFIDAFVDKLCSDICFMIINSAPKAEAFLKKYTTVSLPKAMSANSQTGTQQEPNDSDILGAKYGNGGSAGNQARSYG